VRGTPFLENLKAVVLDIDGTLLFSNDAHASSFVDAAKLLGLPAHWKKIRRLIGKGGDKLIPEAFGLDAKSALGKQLGDLKEKIFRKDYLPDIQPTPGARALLARLRTDGVRLVVATSSTRDVLHLLLARAGVQDLIDDSTSADDADESKPDPDIVLAALSKLSMEPNAVLMLGDTPYDIEAAGQAGIFCIAVRCGGWKDRDLRKAIAVFDDPQDLLDHLSRI
jgi:HAD superfamily hydrolase (TIGR01509 family)